MLYPLTDSSHIGLLVHPEYTYSYMPQLPEQLSSAIQPCPVTLVNGIQCPLRDKILLRPPVSSKTSTGNIKDGGLEGTSQLFRISQSTQTPQMSTQPVRKLLSYPLILELANVQPRLGWYHSPGFKVQLKSCNNKSVVIIEELSTLVDPTFLDHSPATLDTIDQSRRARLNGRAELFRELRCKTVRTLRADKEAHV